VGLGGIAKVSSTVHDIRWPITIVNWCKDDKCDPCAQKFQKLYFALIPGTAQAFYTWIQTIPGTLGDPPNVDPSSFTPPNSPPGWPAFYGDGSSAGTVRGYISGNWSVFGGSSSFVADASSPFPPGDPRTPGTWTVRVGYVASMAVQGIHNGSFIEFPVDGDKIKAIHASPIFYTQTYTDTNWGVGYNFDVDHILVVEVPSS
jgi:hypothetical protein